MCTWEWEGSPCLTKHMKDLRYTNLLILILAGVVHLTLNTWPPLLQGLD